MASIGQSSQLVSKWHDAIQNDCNALEQRTSLDPADEQDAASGAALSMASASSQSRPARRPRTAPSRAPAASRAQNIAAIKSKTQKLFGARHKRLPMVPRGCQGVATTLAFLSEEKGDPVELEYVLAGRVRCKERSFRQDHALQDLDNVLVSKAMPFVTIVSTEDVAQKKVLHGSFRRESYLEAESKGAGIVYEMEGPAPTQAVLIVVAPGWTPAPDLIEAALDTEWTYVDDSDLKKEIEKVDGWPTSCRKAISELLKLKREKKPLATTIGIELKGRLREVLAQRTSERIVRTTKGGDPHLIDLKLGLYLPSVASLLRKSPDDVGRGPERLVIGGHVLVDGETGERWGVGVAGFGGDVSGESALRGVCPADLGSIDQLMPQVGGYGVPYASSVFDPRAIDKDSFHALFHVALAGSASLQGLAIVVYSWNGELEDDTTMSVRGALIINRPSTAVSPSAEIYMKLAPILAIRMCARPSLDSSDSPWALSMLPSYSPPGKSFDAETLKADYPQLTAVLQAPELEPLLASDADHAQAAELVSSSSDGRVSRRVALSLIRQLGEEIEPEKKRKLLESRSCAAEAAKLFEQIKEEKAQRLARVAAQRRDPLIGGIGARFGKKKA